jgi:putative endonuclease
VLALCRSDPARKPARIGTDRVADIGRSIGASKGFGQIEMVGSDVKEAEAPAFAGLTRRGCHKVNPPHGVIPAQAGTSVTLWQIGLGLLMSTGGRYFVYILASRKYGALYVGVTGDLIARVYVHREDILAGQSSKYHIHNLVYLEQHDDPIEAITREKRIKKWRREWKIRLIEEANPGWEDLYPEIAAGG